MDCFVKRFQPDRYDAWMEGRDLAPHPHDDTLRSGLGATGVKKWGKLIGRRVFADPDFVISAYVEICVIFSRF